MKIWFLAVPRLKKWSQCLFRNHTVSQGLSRAGNPALPRAPNRGMSQGQSGLLWKFRSMLLRMSNPLRMEMSKSVTRVDAIAVAPVVPAQDVVPAAMQVGLVMASVPNHRFRKSSSVGRKSLFRSSKRGLAQKVQLLAPTSRSLGAIWCLCPA